MPSPNSAFKTMCLLSELLALRWRLSCLGSSSRFPNTVFNTDFSFQLSDYYFSPKTKKRITRIHRSHGDPCSKFAPLPCQGQLVTSQSHAWPFAKAHYRCLS